MDSLDVIPEAAAGSTSWGVWAVAAMLLLVALALAWRTARHTRRSDATDAEQAPLAVTAARREVRWDITTGAGHVVRLVNRGDDPAYDVTVEHPSFGQPDRHTTFEAGQSVEYIIESMLEVGMGEIVVTFRRLPDAETETFRREL